MRLIIRLYSVLKRRRRINFLFIQISWNIKNKLQNKPMKNDYVPYLPLVIFKIFMDPVLNILL